MPYDLDIDVAPEPASSNVIQLPPGLSKTTSRNGSAISLTGTASWSAGEKSTLGVQLAQNDGRRFSYSYDLVARDKCWLAYAARDSGPWQLHLLDPELSDGKSFAHRVFGASDAEVTSFSFSPDGSFLVYQSTQTGKVGLTLIDLRKLREQPLSFTGNVEQYRWSPDSLLLAVVSRDTNTILGAIDLSGVATSSQLETGIQGVTNIAPLTTGIESAPEWFGEHSLALTTRSSVNSSSYATRYVRVEGQTFSPVVEVNGSYIPLPNTVGFGDGYVVSNGLLLNFINTSTWSNPAVIPHMINSLTSLAPNGAYAGNTSDDGTLLWYAPKSFEFQGAVATSEPGQCSIILAWSDDGFRAACVTDTGPGALRFLKRGVPDSSKLTASVSTNVTDYSQLASNERRRVFSADGRLFGFTTDLNLYVSDIERPQVFFAYRTAEGDTSAARADEANTIDLAFSFDAKFLAEHRANKLTVIAVTSGSNDYWVLDDTMNLAPDCGERYITSPKAWCGAASAPRDYRWSRQANWLAYLNHGQLLNLTYLPGHSHQVQKRSVISKCDDQCIRTLEFQP
jgi:WD40 repeat protein